VGSIPIIVCDEHACEKSGLIGVAVGDGVGGVAVGVGEGAAGDGVGVGVAAAHSAAVKAPPSASPELVNDMNGGFSTCT